MWRVVGCDVGCSGEVMGWRVVGWRGGQVRCTLKPSVAGSAREVGFCQ